MTVTNWQVWFAVPNWSLAFRHHFDRDHDGNRTLVTVARRFSRRGHRLGTLER
jgi:hypothetical protein